ncbi:Purine-rich element binding protein [Gracilaria domingensis]|nr:Purine-rich element binding protein [Gracilaria domingensis]
MGENEADSQQDGIAILGYGNRDELMSVRITVGTRRVTMALCENDRGRFLRLIDNRSRIMVPAAGIMQMREALVALETALESAPPPKQPSQQPQNAEETIKSELISSQRISSEGRKIFLDVMENAKGRYLKICKVSVRRINMIIPIQGLPFLREALDMLLEKTPPDTSVTDPSSVQRLTRTVERVTALNDGASVTLNIVQREIRTMGKRVIFESGANRRGSYIKISENNFPQRTSIILPHSAVPQIVELLQEVMQSGDPAEALESAKAAQT